MNVHHDNTNQGFLFLVPLEQVCLAKFGGSEYAQVTAQTCADS